MGCSASRPIPYPSKNPETHFPPPSAIADSSTSSPQIPRAFSLLTPLIHHPPLTKGDTHHLVSLTSTTYGSLLKFSGGNHSPQFQSPANSADSDQYFSPDSVINTWELMHGLDDSDSQSDVVSHPPIEFPAKPHRSKFMVNPTKCSENNEGTLSPSSSVKPLWQHLSEEALLAKLDPNVVFSYRRALSSRQLGSSNSHCKAVKSVDSSCSLSCSFSNSWSYLPGAGDKVVIYFTSLRGIRKTYEDCCLIRTIFRSFRIAVDERDISMDSSYRKELQTALGGKPVSLPQVFVRGKYIGGAEEIKQLNENGELGNLLVGFPVFDVRFECERCGEARFLPCPNCYGSRKVFEEEEGELRRCSNCNENGLIRCPDCCS